MIKLSAKKSLGQHFLNDPVWQLRIVDAVAARKEDVIVEIGPGTGKLTTYLLHSKLKELIAIEFDARAIPQLREEFQAQGERFKVLEEDVLKVSFSDLAKSAGRLLRIVGNIPYYITSPILFKILEERESITDAVLLVQLEVAERLTANPRTKEYGIPTVLANFFGEVKMLFKIPAAAFKPAPKVDSALISIDLGRDYFTRSELVKPSDFDDEAFRRLVRGSFAMRRKTLRNNLRSMDKSAMIERMEADEAGKKMLSQRAEEFSIPNMIELYSYDNRTDRPPSNLEH